MQSRGDRPVSVARVGFCAGECLGLNCTVPRLVLPFPRPMQVMPIGGGSDRGLPKGGTLVEPLRFTIVGLASLGAFPHARHDLHQRNLSPTLPNNLDHKLGSVHTCSNTLHHANISFRLRQPSRITKLLRYIEREPVIGARPTTAASTHQRAIRESPKRSPSTNNERCAWCSAAIQRWWQ